MLKVYHKSQRKTALATKAPGEGLTLVQFDDRSHPHAHGWHLYPRNAFRPWKYSPLIKVK